VEVTVQFASRAESGAGTTTGYVAGGAVPPGETSGFSVFIAQDQYPEEPISVASVTYADTSSGLGCNK
jgi:hypothetical protein